MSAYDTPHAECPYCLRECEADFVDIGVGMQQVSPYACECGAMQISPYDEPGELSDNEKRVGWYEPEPEPRTLQVGERLTRLPNGDVLVEQEVS